MLQKQLESKTDGGIAYRKRLEYEYGVIVDMGYEDYFLIVQDAINHAKRNGIYVGPGRGSSSASLVSYLLNITEVDPLQYNLLFERFLNPARVTMPDIDIDFEDARRDEVVDYLIEKYGTMNVAHIVTYGTLSAKMAARDVGRVLGFKEDELKMISGLIPETPGRNSRRLFRKMRSGRFQKRIPSMIHMRACVKGLKDCRGIHPPMLPAYCSVQNALPKISR
ncbi:hypothetical protein [Salinicoccus sp. CNSTN-B1]